MGKPIPMVELWRGGLLESTHLGHAVLVDDTGQIVQAWGDPERIIFPRSSCKMIQALPLVESGAADAFGLTTAQLALSCASHQGAALHVNAARDWLAGIGLGEPDLRCGSHEPYDKAERDRLICDHEGPCQLHNNCSGKHAGFLTLTKHLHAGPDYVALDHPLQRAVKAAFEEVTGEASPGHGIDGCSAPNFATSVQGLARAKDELDDFGGLDEANNAGENAKHAAFGAAGDQTRGWRFGVQAAVAGAATRCEHRELPFKPEDARMHDGDPELHRGIVERISRFKRIGAVNHQINAIKK